MSMPSREMIDEYNNAYRLSDSAVMGAIEGGATGAHYGSTSYTTLKQADRLIDLLELQPDRLALDIGCGAGWPGIHLAKQSGCRVSMVDVPFEGLRRALNQCLTESINGHVVAAAGARLPFKPQTFDAVSHSDVLC